MKENVRGRDLIGRAIVAEESGRKLGTVGDVSFITDSGELMGLTLLEPSKHAEDIHLQQDDHGRLTVPFSAVKSVGDFVIVSEKDIL